MAVGNINDSRAAFVQSLIRSAGGEWVGASCMESGLGSRVYYVSVSK